MPWAEPPSWPAVAAVCTGSRSPSYSRSPLPHPTPGSCWSRSSARQGDPNVLWQDEQISAISAALEAARSGQPTVLSVLGEPGMGKTSLLSEIASRAPEFNVLQADGRESAYREPFDLLRQLGVHDDHSPGGIPRDPLAATQSLRDLVD